MGYEHTQRSPWVAALLFVIVIGILVAITLGDMPLWARLVFGAVALAFYWLLDTFSRLTVRVESGMAFVAFGRGWPRRLIDLRQVEGVGPVRSKWWYGWGMRRIPSGWMWNVSGLDAVEFRLPDTTFTVGTDQPGELLAALRPWLRDA